jgi:hypothetical protein
MIGSKFRWAMMVGALAIAAPMVAGCPKKDDTSSKSSDSKKDDKKDDKKGEKSADDDDKDSKEYAQGDILKHVPKKCSLGRVYLNYAGLTDEPAVKKNIHKLDDKFAEAMKGKNGDKAKDILKILEKAEIDPAKDIREIAVCANGEDDVIVAVAGDFGGKDVLGALVKIADKEGETLKKKDADGIPYLKGKDKMMLGQVTPTVFVATKDTDDFAKLAKSEDQSADWEVSKGRLIVVKGAMKKQGVDSLLAELTEKGDALELKIVAELSGKAAKEMDAEDDAEGKLKKVIAQAADKVEKSPMKDLADDIRDAKVKIDGHKITFSMKCSNKDLGKAIAAISEASESDLENLGD